MLFRTMDLDWTLAAVTYMTSFYFFFNDTATTEIYTLSLHDALPISRFSRRRHFAALARVGSGGGIDPEGIGICAPGTPSPHLYEGSSRERVCTRDAKPSCLGDGGGETARGFPDPWKQDAA